MYQLTLANVLVKGWIVDLFIYVGNYICQHKPMAITSAITYVVHHLTQHVSVEKLQNISTAIHIRCWRLLNIIFSTDLGKPCCWHGVSLSQLTKNFCFEKN